MHIHCLQHVSFENPGTIKDWALENNHAITYTYFFDHPLQRIRGGFAQQGTVPHSESVDGRQGWAGGRKGTNGIMDENDGFWFIW